MNPSSSSSPTEHDPNAKGMRTWDGITMLDRSAGPTRRLYQLHVDLPVSKAEASQFAAGMLDPNYTAVAAVLTAANLAYPLPYLPDLINAWTPSRGPAGVPALGIWTLGVEERIAIGVATWFVVLRATIDLDGVTNATSQAYGGGALLSALVQPKTTVSDPAAEAMQDITGWVDREVAAGSVDYPSVSEIMKLFYMS